MTDIKLLTIPAPGPAGTALTIEHPAYHVRLVLESTGTAWVVKDLYPKRLEKQAEVVEGANQ